MSSEFTKMSLKETKERLQKLPELFNEIENLLKDEPVRAATHNMASTRRAQALMEYVRLLLSIKEKAEKNLNLRPNRSKISTFFKSFKRRK